MSAMVSQITGISYSTVCSGADQRIHQNSASLVTGEFPNKGPVTQKIFPFDDVIVHLFAVTISWTGLNRSEIPNGGIMMTWSNGNIFRVTGPLCGEFTGHRWIPLTKASDAELWCFLWSASWINGWVNNREAGDLRRNRAHYDVIAIYTRWNGNVVSLVKFSSSDVSEVVKMTTSNATRDENFRFS